MLPVQTDVHEFGTKLAKVVSPARPIQSIEFLHGRASELNRIEKALFASGRHVFIFGDRGVGKSSLAAAAAHQCQSADASYIDVSCSPDSTLRSIVANIGYQAINASRTRRVRRTISTGIECRFLKAGVSEEVSVQDLHSEIHGLGDAVEVLREVALIHSERPVVVLDEFDRMTDTVERNLFADLVKHLGDKKVGITFFFTGVARTLEDLLGAHPSAIRQFETIELPKLSWTARWDIAINAASAFGVEIEPNIRTRIAAVSDGYPYYVHLIAEKLLWRVYEDPSPVTNVTWEHYHDALRDAIESINAELRRPYEMAVSQRPEDFEEVLWSTADSDYLDRTLTDIFSSYSYLMRQRLGRPMLDYEAFTAIIRKLKGKACGEILVPSRFNRRGWVSYRENVLRGYVRMQAESHGIELVGEQADLPRQKMHAPASATRGYYGPSIPKGVHQGRRR